MNTLIGPGKMVKCDECQVCPWATDLEKTQQWELGKMIDDGKGIDVHKASRHSPSGIIGALLAFGISKDNSGSFNQVRFVLIERPSR